MLRLGSTRRSNSQPDPLKVSARQNHSALTTLQLFRCAAPAPPATVGLRWGSHRRDSTRRKDEYIIWRRNVSRRLCCLHPKRSPRSYSTAGLVRLREAGAQSASGSYAPWNRDWEPYVFLNATALMSGRKKSTDENASAGPPRFQPDFWGWHALCAFPPTTSHSHPGGQGRQTL